MRNLCVPLFCCAVGLCQFASANPVKALPSIEPLLRSIDLSLGETEEVKLSDGATATVTLLGVEEERDLVQGAIRQAEVTLLVNGEKVRLASGNYTLPQAIAGVQIDCPVTKGYRQSGSQDRWNLREDARLRLWPAGSPYVRPGTFAYPVKQRWFASDTQMANEPTFVNGGEGPDRRGNIYYHFGLDIGGAEGETEVIAATDGIVVSSGEATLADHPIDVPERYDVVYIVDGRGWYYRYSHLKSIDPAIRPGARVSMRQPVGILGKEGGSGGWAHLHFEVDEPQADGSLAVQEGYAFLWQAYLQEYQPELIAVARPHIYTTTGQEIVLDPSRSWSANGDPLSFQWRLPDGAWKGPAAVVAFEEPGYYSIPLKATDGAGNSDYDFQVIEVVDPMNADTPPPTLNASYTPTFDIHPGDTITFKARTFRTDHGEETWDFGDGSPTVSTKSVPRPQRAPDGYATVKHRYQRAGEYLVTVSRANEQGAVATAHLHVSVHPPLSSPGR